MYGRKLESEIVHYYTNLSDSEYKTELLPSLIISSDETIKKGDEY